MHIKPWIKKTIIGIIGLFFIYLIIPFKSPFLQTDFSQLVLDRNGQMLRAFLNEDEQWCLPSHDSIFVPERLEKAVLCFEDEYFNWHPGVNPISLVRAVIQNIENRRIVSGASTITMQLARLRKNRPRTLSNKLVEIIEAIKIDIHYRKKSILKMYLENAPYGGNIIGFRTASLRYFDKPAEELSWAEASTLAVLPNAPGLVSPVSRQNMLLNKRNFLLKKLLDKKAISQTSYSLALHEPLPDKIYHFRTIAPHLSQKVIKENPEKQIIQTTIDAKHQNNIEQICTNHNLFLKRLGIRNLAAIVLNTQSGEVISYVGSQNFFDIKNQGQVDGVMASRSSGSVLKPFLYALSIDEGIIIPETQMKDVPSFFNAFSPNNADEKFDGIVNAKDALIRSLNVPAVRLLNTYGIYRFYTFLNQAGVTTLFRTAEDYGLPLIIGGAEVNLLEMAMIYRGLAHSGMFSSPTYLYGNTNQLSKQLISDGAAYLTLDMLNDLKRPGAEYYWKQYLNQQPIAWKTGTSYGHKDGWAIGVSPQWTIGVWSGNFDGEGNVNLSGAASAGTLLFDILNYLPSDPELMWFEQADIDFKKAVICHQTGFLAGPHCDNQDTVDVPFNMFPLRQCPYHKNFYFNRDENYAVCSECWKQDHIERNLLIYPPDVVTQLRKRGKVVDSPPDHNPECSHLLSEDALRFIYPIDSAQIWIPRDFGGKVQKLVARIAHKKISNTVFWYLDDTYLGATVNEHEKAIVLSPGWHKLLVCDEENNNDRISLFIGRSQN